MTEQGSESQPYGAPELGPYRRDAGLYASGLTGRYPGLRGSGARDPRIHSTGPGAGAEQSPERAALLAGRIAITATIVVGQLWALDRGAQRLARGSDRSGRGPVRVPAGLVRSGHRRVAVGAPRPLR